MGDRTWVNLYVPSELADEARKIIEKRDGKPTEDCDGDAVDGSIHCFGFSEVNYGELDCLDDLQAAGIAYDSSWDDGGDYTSGTQSCRFTKDGEAVVKTLYDNSLGMDAHTLLANIENHDKLKELILAHIEEISVLPWDNQVDYGKTYRVRQLICPT